MALSKLKKEIQEDMKQEIKCQDCSIKQLCLPVMLADSEVAHLDNIIQRGKPLHKNDMVFYAGDDFKGIYAIRSGSLKTYTISPEGVEQITGFHLPGEIVGLDAISINRHPSFAKALETSSVCQIPFDRLEELSCQIPSLQKQMLHVMSREIYEDQELLLLLSKKSADQRFASFLVNLAARFGRRGFSASRFRLTMTRADISNYLGLAVETVSRLLTKLVKQDLIMVNDKEIEIVNMKELAALAGTVCD
jgi:CRP/FNR family transcriptional regulator, anaerobic regulatory protein